MIIITGHVRIRSGEHERATALGKTHSQRSRAEPGCFAHNCLIDAEDPDRMVFIEEWADMTAVRQHFAVPESGQFVRDISALANEPPVMRLFEAGEVQRG